MSEVPYDLAVVGAGLTGKMSAPLPAELGSKVFEAGRDAKCPANSRYTGGVFHVAFTDDRTEPRESRRGTEEATGGFPDDGLASTLAETAARAMLGRVNTERSQRPRIGSEHAHRKDSQ